MALTCLAVLAALVAGPAVPRQQQRTAGAALTTVAPDERSALAAARAEGRPVEALADRTEYSQMFANPSGTLTLDETTVPVRARLADGSWLPIDTTLRPQADGTVGPAVALAGVAFSGGGTGAMATMRSGPATLTFWWPASLPAPELSGGTATYADVLPGVDLQLRATAVGFSQLLVVKTAAAAADPALSDLRLPVRASGASLSADAAGVVTAVDGTGRQVFQTPASSMWDSGSRHGTVAVSVAGGALDLRPDPAMLADPATRYPVTIDPNWVGWSRQKENWTKTEEQSPDVSYWNGQNDSDPNDFGAVKMGRAPSPDDTLWRSYFEFDSTRIDGKVINTATFTVWETWSVSCAAKEIELDLTGRISSATTWDSPPSTVQTLFNGSLNAYGHDSGCPGPHEVDFDVRSVAEQASDASWPDITLGLRAPDEGTCLADATHDTCEWRKFDSGAIVGQHSPTLSVTYDTPPDQPSNVYFDGSQFLYPGGQVPCDGQAHSVNTGQPVVHAFLTDPDEPAVAQPLTLVVNWSTFDAGGTQVASGQISSTPTNGDGWATVTLPAGQVPNGGSVQETMHARDDIKDGPSTPNCILTVDTTGQRKPPGVTSADGRFPCGGAALTPAGTSGKFTFTPPDSTPPSFGDVAGYLYGMNTPPWKLVPINPTDGGATVTATPAYFGNDDLQVQVIGRGGTLGPITDCLVGTTHPTGPAVVARWNLDETSGSVAQDGVGGHDLALNAGTGAWNWTSSGHTGGALHLSGGAVAAGPEPVVDTQYGFTVSAWVNLDNLDGGATVVDLDGKYSPAFSLRYSHFQNLWVFGMATSDTAPNAPITTVVSDSPPVAGTWIHLIGVYCDSTACGATGTNPGVMYLYVGTGTNPPQLQSSQQPFTSAWRTSGGVHLGAAEDGNGGYMDFLNGSVDDVSVYWADPCPAPVKNQINVCNIP